jgi:glycogen(starch) synthase
VRILLVGDYPPPYGGIAVHLQHLTRTLPQEGIHCRVLNIGPNRRLRSPEYDSVRGPREFLRRLILYARAGYLLHLFTNGENPKSWMLTLLVGLAGRILGTPAVVTITSGGAPAYLASAGSWLRFTARVAVALPAAVVCRTQAIADALRPWRTGNLSVIPAFSLARLRAAERPPEDVIAFALAHSPLLVSVAILRREYDLPTLLQAFRDLRKQHPAAGLVIVGGGEDEARVRELIELWQLGEAVLLTGWVTHETCLAIIREADLFVRTTLYDGDASSVREALALGVPVVASRTDFRPAGPTLFTPGDPEALHAALVETLAVGAARRRASRRAKLAAPPAGDRSLLALYRSLSPAPARVPVGRRGRARPSREAS